MRRKIKNKKQTKTIRQKHLELHLVELLSSKWLKMWRKRCGKTRPDSENGEKPECGTSSETSLLMNRSDDKSTEQLRVHGHPKPVQLAGTYITTMKRSDKKKTDFNAIDVRHGTEFKVAKLSQPRRGQKWSGNNVRLHWSSGSSRSTMNFDLEFSVCQTRSRDDEAKNVHFHRGLDSFRIGWGKMCALGAWYIEHVDHVREMKSEIYWYAMERSNETKSMNFQFHVQLANTKHMRYTLCGPSVCGNSIGARNSVFFYFWSTAAAEPKHDQNECAQMSWTFPLICIRVISN